MYYNEDTIVYFDGAFIKAGDVRANIYDQAVHYGYAVFEGIRAYDTEEGIKIFKAKEHYDRLKFSAEAVGIPYSFSSEELIEISYDILKRNNNKNAYLRPLVTTTPNMSLGKAKGSKLFIGAWEWPALLGEKLIRLKTSSIRRLSPASFKVEAKVSGHYINSILASQEAKDAGYDEALMLDVEGFIAEGPGANFFVEINGVLHTPALGSILPGITRATVIELCNELDIEVVERKINLEEVYGADAAFLCGTAAEVIGLEALDDVPFSKPWKETQSVKIQSAYKNLVTGKTLRALSSVA